MNKIITAIYNCCHEYDEGNERDYKYFFFNDIKNEQGITICDKGMCKITKLLYYAENAMDLTKGKEYKLTLDEMNSYLNLPSKEVPRFKNPVQIECDEFVFYRKGNRYFREDKINREVKEYTYHRGLRF